MWAPADDPSASAAPTAEPAPGAEPDPAPVEPTAPDYSFLPEAYRGDDGPDVDGFKTHYDDLIAEKAIRDEAMAGVPEDAKGYEFAAPTEVDYGDLDLPEGFAIELRPEDPTMAPLFEELGGMLHDLKAPAEATGKFMQMLAKYEAAKYAPMHAAGKAEMEALGTAAEARITKVNHAIDTRLSADEATALKAATTTANGVRALEKLLLGKQMQAPTPTPAEGEADVLASRYKNSTAK